MSMGDLTNPKPVRWTLRFWSLVQELSKLTQVSPGTLIRQRAENALMKDFMEQIEERKELHKEMGKTRKKARRA